MYPAIVKFTLKKHFNTSPITFRANCREDILLAIAKAKLNRLEDISIKPYCAT